MRKRLRRRRLERELARESASEHRRLLRHHPFSEHETGSAEPRGRPTISVAEANDLLGAAVGRQVDLPTGAMVYTSPENCPVCGARDPLHGDDDRRLLDLARLHPIAANAIDGAAESDS